jgi:uncharacterized peroxidase-related enzyme
LSDRGGTGSLFPVPPEAQLPENLQKLFAKARSTLGFVPNVFRVYSFRPQRLSAWFAHYRQLHEPSANLSAADREMIAVVVSSANGCLYCLVAPERRCATSSGTRCSGTGGGLGSTSAGWRSASTPTS